MKWLLSAIVIGLMVGCGDADDLNHLQGEVKKLQEQLQEIQAKVNNVESNWGELYIGESPKAFALDKVDYSIEDKMLRTRLIINGQLVAKQKVPPLLYLQLAYQLDFGESVPPVAGTTWVLLENGFGAFKVAQGLSLHEMSEADAKLNFKILGWMPAHSAKLIGG